MTSNRVTPSFSSRNTAYESRSRYIETNRFPVVTLVQSTDERDAFLIKYKIPKFEAAKLTAGTTVKGYIGLDGGSTSSKCVFIDEDGEILKKVYQLSKGNPIQDMKDMFAQ